MLRSAASQLLSTARSAIRLQAIRASSGKGSLQMTRKYQAYALAEKFVESEGHHHNDTVHSLNCLIHVSTSKLICCHRMCDSQVPCLTYDLLCMVDRNCLFYKFNNNAG